MKQLFLGAAALAAALALTPAAIAHPMGGGMGHGGFGGGFGHAGMSHMGRFSHGGFGRTGFESFRHNGIRHMGGLHRASFRHSGMSHRLRTAHTGHHGHSGLMPSGFSHGKASWKQNGGTPPGWSKGNKKGWNCMPGSSGCVPPGLQD
jgi:hypothetical protein